MKLIFSQYYFYVKNILYFPAKNIAETFREWKREKERKVGKEKERDRDSEIDRECRESRGKLKRKREKVD